MLSPLSPTKWSTLMSLERAGATSFETGQNAYNAGGQRLNANVLARLQAAGLTDSRVKRLGRGHQATLYWLTPAGVERLNSSR